MRRSPITLAALAFTAAIALSTAAPALAGAGGGGGGGICDGFARGDRIRMHDNCFAGTAHLVDPAMDTVDVTNDGQMPHTITAVDGTFDVYLEAGETAAVDLPDDAVIPVYCTLHGTSAGAGMAGVIVRHGDSGVTATAEETAAAANLAALDASTGEQDSGIAVVALVVAGIAAALALASIATTFRARRSAVASESGQLGH